MAKLVVEAPDFLASQPIPYSRVGRVEVEIKNGKEVVNQYFAAEINVEPNYDQPYVNAGFENYWNFCDAFVKNDEEMCNKFAEHIFTDPIVVTPAIKDRDTLKKTTTNIEYSFFDMVDLPALAFKHNVSLALLNPSRGTIVRSYAKGIVVPLYFIEAKDKEYQDYRKTIDDLLAAIGAPMKQITTTWEHLPRNVLYYAGFSADKCELHEVRHFIGFEFNPYEAIAIGRTFKSMVVKEEYTYYEYARSGYIGTLHHFKHPNAYRYAADAVQKYLERSPNWRRKHNFTYKNMFCMLSTYYVAITFQAEDGDRPTSFVELRHSRIKECEWKYIDVEFDDGSVALERLLIGSNNTSTTEELETLNITDDVDGLAILDFPDRDDYDNDEIIVDIDRPFTFDQRQDIISKIVGFSKLKYHAHKLPTDNVVAHPMLATIYIDPAVAMYGTLHDVDVQEKVVFTDFYEIRGNCYPIVLSLNKFDYHTIDYGLEGQDVIVKAANTSSRSIITTYPKELPADVQQKLNASLQKGLNVRKMHGLTAPSSSSFFGSNVIRTKIHVIDGKEYMLRPDTQVLLSADENVMFLPGDGSVGMEVSKDGNFHDPADPSLKYRVKYDPYMLFNTVSLFDVVHDQSNFCSETWSDILGINSTDLPLSLDIEFDERYD